MLKTLSALKAEAKVLQEQAGPLPPDEDPKSAQDALHCRLAEEFVQHLIAHSLYWSPERVEEGGKRSR